MPLLFCMPHRYVEIVGLGPYLLIYTGMAD